MAIPRVARIHLVYQYIILLLFVFAFACYEFSLNKMHLFVVLIPVLFYQLVIVFCCTELLPLPQWMNWTDAPMASTSEQDNVEDSIPITSVKDERNPLSSTSPRFTTSPTQQIFWKCNLKKKEIGNNLDKNRISPKVLDALEKEAKKNNMEMDPNDYSIEKDTKVYFPQRRKRLEEWLEPKENIRPFKVRNWKSENAYNNSRSLPNQKIPSIQIEKIEESEETHKQFEESVDIAKSKKTRDLIKSYSYPYRRRKLENWVELDKIIENDSEIPAMPPWHTLNFCKTERRNEKKPRKSLSTEALDKELKLIKSRCQQSKNDFTQSLELSGPIDIDDCVPKKNVLKPVTNLSRFKQGIVNCFNRNKKENCKDDDMKQNMETKRQFFKDMFQSRESLVQETEGKGSTGKNKNLNSENKSEIRKKLSFLSPPSYFSFANDSFDGDPNVTNSQKS